MKRNLRYLLTILCTLSLFTACDEKEEVYPLQWLSNTYQNDKLILQLNGKYVKDKPVVFELTNQMEGVVTLTDIIQDDSQIKIHVALSASEYGFEFSGAAELNEIDVNVTGSFEWGKMKLNVRTIGWDIEYTDYAADKLSMKVNGMPVDGITVGMGKTSELEGTVVLKKFLYGYLDLRVPVTMVFTKSTEKTYIYRFSGSDTTPDFTVEVDGTIDTANGMLELNVTMDEPALLTKRYSGDSLSVTTNGELQGNYPVSLVVHNSELKATLTFQQIVHVANNISIPVQLTKQGNEYLIVGEQYLEKGFLIRVSGKLARGILSLDVTVTGYALVMKTYTADDLRLTYCGRVMEGGTLTRPSVELKGSTVDNVTIILCNVIPGLYENRSGNLAAHNVKLEKAADSETYSFKGETTYGSSRITFNGTVSPENVMTISVDHVIKSEITGKWNIAPRSDGLADVHFGFGSAAGGITVPEALISLLPEQHLPDTMNDESVNTLIGGLLQKYATYWKYVEFKEDGSITIGYSRVQSETVVEELVDMIHYTVKDGVVMITPNLNKLMAMYPLPTSAYGIKSFDPIDLLSGGGFPFRFAAAGSTLELSVDKEVIAPTIWFSIGYVIPILEQVMKLDRKTMDTIYGIAGPINEIVGQCKHIEIGIRLNR